MSSGLSPGIEGTGHTVMVRDSDLSTELTVGCCLGGNRAGRSGLGEL